MNSLITTTVILRKGELWDVFYNGFNKRLGQPFWVKSLETGEFDNRGYLVDQSTNSRELKGWVENGMLYVPASDLDLKRANKGPNPKGPVEKQFNSNIKTA